MHHTLLHVYTSQTNTDFVNSNVPETSVSNSVQCHSPIQNYNVLLSTALNNIKSNTCNVIQCRTLIGNASQQSLISKNYIARLNWPVCSTNPMLVGKKGIFAKTYLNFTEFIFSPYFSHN